MHVERPVYKIKYNYVYRGHQTLDPNLQSEGRGLCLPDYSYKLWDEPMNSDNLYKDTTEAEEHVLTDLGGLIKIVDKRSYNIICTYIELMRLHMRNHNSLASTCGNFPQLV